MQTYGFDSLWSLPAFVVGLIISVWQCLIRSSGSVELPGPGQNEAKTGCRLASLPYQTPRKCSLLSASEPLEWNQLSVLYYGGCLSIGAIHKGHFYGPTDKQAPAG